MQYRKTIIETINAIEWTGKNIDEVFDTIGTLGFNIWGKDGGLYFGGHKITVGVFIVRDSCGVISEKSPDEMLEYRRVK